MNFGPRDYDYDYEDYDKSSDTEENWWEKIPDVYSKSVEDQVIEKMEFEEEYGLYDEDDKYDEDDEDDYLSVFLKEELDAICKK